MPHIIPPPPPPPTTPFFFPSPRPKGNEHEKIKTLLSL